MPAKKRPLRAHPLYFEAEALKVNHEQIPSETNDPDEYIYDSDEDDVGNNVNKPSTNMTIDQINLQFVCLLHS